MGEAARQGFARRWAAAIAVAVAGSAALSAAASGGALAPGPVIRVLLRETDGVTLRRGARGGSDTRIEARDGRLWANRKAVGQRWRFEGSDRGIVRADRMRVRGDLVVHRVGRRIQVVNEVGLEAYVAGTIGREIYPGWHRETLKAQAVVARTYALYRRLRAGSAAFDLGSGTGSQVYGGVDAETPALVAAVAETRGEILTHASEPILAVYHSAAGGRTATAEEVWGEALPYLVSVPVPDEQDSPDTYWRATISRPKLGRALTSLGIRFGSGSGSVTDVEVVERSPSGRAVSVRLRGVDADGKESNHTIEARALRGALGVSVIRSTMFEIRNHEGKFVIVGSGHGHGVGMSQWGAEAMAQRGDGYRQILAAFYPGAKLQRGGLR